MERAITFDIVCYKLSSLYQLVPARGFTGNRQLKNVRLYEENEPDQNYLYIASYDDYLHRRPAGMRCPAVVTGFPEGADIPDGNAVLIPECQAEPRAVFSQASAVFADFYEWREQLHDFDRDGSGLNALLKRAAGFMEMELTITDKAYRSDFSTRRDKAKDDDPLGMYLLNRDEMLNLLSTQPEFVESFTTHGVQSYPSPYLGLLYYYNIFYEEEYLARLLAITPTRPFQQGCVRLIDYLSEFVERAFLKYQHGIGLQHKNARFLAALEDLLTGQTQDFLTAREDLARYGWQDGHVYQVIKLNLDEYQGNMVSRNYFCAHFDIKFPSCCTMQIQDEILSVRNLTLETEEIHFNQDFPVFLRENLCRAGISNQAAGIGRLAQLTMEARDAVFYGRQKNSTFWYWYFEDYVLDYFRAHAVRQYGADQLEHRALGILRDYDAQNNGALYETLHMFVRQRFSASAAAAALFIHRSTFLHRLNRILELTKLDFQDERQRTWLTISFFIAEGLPTRK